MIHPWRFSPRFEIMNVQKKKFFKKTHGDFYYTIELWVYDGTARTNNKKEKKKKLKESKSMAAQQRDSTSTTRKPAVRPQLYEICRVLRCLPLPKDTFVIATSNFPNNNSKPLYTLWKFLKERRTEKKQHVVSVLADVSFFFLTVTCS